VVDGNIYGHGTLCLCMADATVTVENIVASTKIAEGLDLVELDKNLSDTKYQPKVFPGLVLHIAQPKVAFLLFSTGKMVITGAKTKRDIQKAVGKLLDMLREADIPVIDIPDVEVRNIVASGDLQGRLDLPATALALGLENVEYEPEIFPGLVYRGSSEEGVVMLLFSSGRVVCTGAREPERASQAVIQLQKDLDARGLLIS